MIGVKAELGVPDPTSPDAGRIEFFVDWYIGEQLKHAHDSKNDNIIISNMY